MSAVGAPCGTIREIGAAYRSGALTPTAVVRESLKSIAALNGRLNCFITVLDESALRAAEESDRRFREGRPLGELDGVPVAVKDVIYIEGVRCTAGSKILAGNVAQYDAPSVRKLRAAGAVIVGTTNLHEFAAGTTSDNPHYGPVRNPWDQGKIAGGSSGGSAAAVASGLAAAALGTDTAGSVRIPAALCGVLGIKPTYGRVSRLGVVPLASSLDTVGVIARSAWDASAVLQVIAGGDPADVTTTNEEVPDFLAALALPSAPARVGVVKDYFYDALDQAVEEDVEAFLSRLREMGCQVSLAHLDGIDEVYEKWVPIRRAEATAFHLRWLEQTPELYGDDVRRLLEQGKDVLAVDYVNAINARPSYMERFAASMKGFDVLAAPCTAIPAPAIGQSTVSLKGNRVPVYSALNRLTLPFNYVGFPAISIPSGSAGGTPLGVQLVGKLFDEATLLRLAAAYEERFGLFPRPSGGTSAAPTG
jgi:Asp-tRNA(Asn)/Glu-tRNA(Gln) amidotransferase A subunit family amidase